MRILIKEFFMKSIFKTAALIITLAFTAVSCSSDDDNNSNEGAGSRDVKYEITGNFTGELDVTYIEKGGNALNEDINSLPWVKEFTADAKSSGATVGTSGIGGVQGQKITVKMFIGGKVVNELTAEANNNGGISASLTPYVFPQ
jgi:hypothetical protein